MNESGIKKKKTNQEENNERINDERLCVCIKLLFKCDGYHGKQIDLFVLSFYCF